MIISEKNIDRTLPNGYYMETRSKTGEESLVRRMPVIVDTPADICQFLKKYVESQFDYGRIKYCRKRLK